MAVDCMCREREMTVTLSGELDHHGAKQIMARMDSRIDLELPRQLTVDMSGVTFTDSSLHISPLCASKKRIAMSLSNLP